MSRQAWLAAAIERMNGLYLRVSSELVLLDGAGDMALLGSGVSGQTVGRPLAELSPALADPLLVAKIEGVLREGRSTFYLLVDARTDSGLGLGCHICRLSQGEVVLHLSLTSDVERRSLVDRIADELPSVVAYLDTDLCYRFNNRAFEAFIGQSRQSLFGKRVDVIVGAESFARLQPYFSRVLAGERVCYEDSLALKDGRHVHLKVQYLPDIQGGEVVGFYALIDDVTEYSRMLALLREVYRLVNRTDISNHQIINDILRRSLDFLDLDVGMVSQIVGHDYSVAWVQPPDQGLRPGQMFALGDTYCHLLLQYGDVFHTTDAGSDGRINGHPCYRQSRLETYIGIPLRLAGKLWGTLNFTSTASRSRPFDDAEIELLRLLGSAIERVVADRHVIEAVRAERDELETQVLTDALTQLPNRLAYQRHTAALEASLEHSPTEVVLAVFDVDHFKAVNDGHGHLVGDQVLSWLAKTLGSVLRVDDFCARIGGEEFCLIMTDTSSHHYPTVLERMRARAESGRFALDNGDVLSITISIGVAHRHPGEAMQAVFRRADDALYQAKRAGRNRIWVAPPKG